MSQFVSGARRQLIFSDPPPGYVPGLGRGATGFTTRSDIGPMKDPTAPIVAERGEFNPALSRGRGAFLAATAAGAGETAMAVAAAAVAASGVPVTVPASLPMPAAAAAQPTPGNEDRETEDVSDANYDQFSGYGEKLYDVTAPYDEEDKEADEIYESIDKKLDSRRAEKREAYYKESIEKFRASQPKLEQQHNELKRQLAAVTEEEWMAIPDATDQVSKRKKRQNNYERYTPVPDNLIMSSANKSVATSQPLSNEMAGMLTPMTTDGFASTIKGEATSLTQIGTVKGVLMSIKLDGISSTIAGQTSSTDVNRYLTDLSSLKRVGDDEMGDYNKTKTLLKSLRSTNPNHAPAWIASARLEEYGGKIAQARRMILKGTEMCKTSEEVWLEAARLHPKDQAKSLLAKAVQVVPKAVEVWLRATDFEEDVETKKLILRRALEFVPTSARLWESAIQLEADPENARVMLTRAVECVPKSTKMWLALAKLETADRAREVLNTARTFIPTEPAIWITGAKLEEVVTGDAERVRTVIKRCVKSLRKNGVNMDRDAWMKEAISAESSGSILTCRAIVAETISIGVEDAARRKQWKNDAKAFLAEGHVACARAAYACALQAFPDNEKLWICSAELEKKEKLKGAANDVQGVLKQATTNCKQSEVLWLMYAKEAWLRGEVPAARSILEEAFSSLPGSESIWLAAAKLENENGEQVRARNLLERSRNICNTKRVWKRSVVLEKELRNKDGMLKLLTEGLARFPRFEKLWLLRCELAEEMERERSENIGASSTPEEGQSAKELYQSGLRNCPGSIQLWINAARCEEKDGSAASCARARVLLERARQVILHSPELWLEAIRAEVRVGNKKAALNLLPRAIQDCPKSGILLAEDILLETNPEARRKKSTSALSITDDPHLLLAVARVFVIERRFDKARNWFQKGSIKDPQLGDVWAAWYAMEQRHGTAEGAAAVEKQCAATQPSPTKGERWRSISKKVENWHLPVSEILKKVAEFFTE
eukprot:TRINITY_DN911_c0_g1_i1.p1 TRINITY_DN911_c0_g1~~TRINITY_DN911_c0_g1_i1.p1  ORF type:complete len:1003 (-),score=265.51 TRINITY_DN911_c0_g1_i1:93-3101(-)